MVHDLALFKKKSLPFPAEEVERSNKRKELVTQTNLDIHVFGSRTTSQITNKKII